LILYVLHSSQFLNSSCKLSYYTWQAESSLTISGQAEPVLIKATKSTRRSVYNK